MDMDREFDQMIRDRMNEALEAALKSQTLGRLALAQESRRGRLQRQLGELLIILGLRLRDGAAGSIHHAARSGW